MSSFFAVIAAISLGVIMRTANYIISFLLIWYCISKADMFGLLLAMIRFLMMLTLLEE